ncbi:MAG TPA: TolC family protein [Thermoanaerobaculia bacterium]|nr:TolC family protein [Thermoanaerobaculia bacterium]
MTSELRKARGVPAPAVVASAVACLALAACASAPRDAGFGDVQRGVTASTGQEIAWDPQQAIEAPADAAVAAQLAEPLTADRAVEIALRYNRDLLATLEELGIARADLLQARTLRNPFAEAELRFPASPSRPFEVILMQPLFDLLKLHARRAAGEAAFEVTKLRTTAAVVAFANEVRADFYRAQAARQLLASQATIADAARAAAELAHKQHEVGNVSDLDFEREQTRYDAAKLELQRAELEELQARERLIADLGLAQPPATLDLPAELPPVAEDAPPAAALDEALAGRLDLGLARADLAAARARLPLARGPVYADVAAGVHHEREPQGERTTGPALELPIPIFDSGRARRERALAVVRQAEQRVHAIDLAGRSAARTAAERLREARARAEYLRDVVVPRRQRILELTQLETNAMLRGVFDLFRARQDLDEARREEVLARRDYWVAKSELQSALLGVKGFEPQGGATTMKESE